MSTGSASFLPALAGLDALVVVVDRHGERLLGDVLADHVVLEELEDLARLGQLVETGGLCELLLDDLVAQVDALVTDVDTRTGDQLLDLLLALPAERALEQVAAVPIRATDGPPVAGSRHETGADATRPPPSGSIERPETPTSRPCPLTADKGAACRLLRFSYHFQRGEYFPTSRTGQYERPRAPGAAPRSPR